MDPQSQCQTSNSDVLLKAIGSESDVLLKSLGSDNRQVKYIKISNYTIPRNIGYQGIQCIFDRYPNDLIYQLY